MITNVITRTYTCDNCGGTVSQTPYPSGWIAVPNPKSFPKTHDACSIPCADAIMGVTGIQSEALVKNVSLASTLVKSTTLTVSPQSTIKSSSSIR